MDKIMRAIFLKINGQAKENEEQKVINDSRTLSMSEKLVWYKDVEFIRTSKERKNFVDYVLAKRKEKGSVEYFLEFITLIKLVRKLPNYFVQVNRKEIINLYYITGKSQTHIFMRNVSCRIGKTYRKKVNQIINSFLVEETQQ